MKMLKLKPTVAELNSHGSALIEDADGRGGRSTEGLFSGRKTPEGTETRKCQQSLRHVGPCQGSNIRVTGTPEGEERDSGPTWWAQTT